MSSPITFSGFNNIDFNSILNSLMTEASQPLTALQSHQTDLQTQFSGFDALNTRISSLRSAADALSTLSAVSTVSGTSSDSAVGVATTTDAVVGHYDVVVTDLARAQVTATTSTTADANTTIVASGGTLTIGGVDVTVSGDSTLQQLATAINTTTGIGVTAAVVRTAANSYRLALTSQSSGLANAFTVTNNLTGGAGVTFGSTNAVAASDAAITVNNIPVTSASNTFENVMPGLTLTVSQKDATKTIGIDVASDTQSLSTNVNNFVSAYNNVIQYLDSQRGTAANGDTGSIGRDPMLRQLRSSLRNELLGPHGSATFTRLTEVGIEFTTTGTITLNQSRFDAAVAANGDSVRTLFAGTGGAFPAVESLLDGYSTPGTGLISGVQDRLTKQIANMDDQIASMQARLAVQRASLQLEFTQADAAMTQLKNQSGSLSSTTSDLTSL